MQDQIPVKEQERQFKKEQDKAAEPWDFLERNMNCIAPGNFYNHGTKTFKKNKRKGY